MKLNRTSAFEIEGTVAPVAFRRVVASNIVVFPLMTGSDFMRYVAITALLLVTIGASAQVNLTLNAGDTYTFQFSSLSFQGIWDVQQPPGVPIGEINGLFLPDSFQPGSSLLVEMFEDSTSLSPIASQVLISQVGFSPPPGPLLWSLDAWQDLQGAVRLSMLSGSATIDLFQVTVNRDDSGMLNSYGSSALPVPEPNSILLIGVAALLGALMRLYRPASTLCFKKECPF